MELKDRLRALRNEKGVPASKLASDLGKAESTLRMWEIGKANPDIDTLTTLSKYFNVSVDYLLGLTDIRTVDLTTKSICQFTGLSENAIEVLYALSNTGYYGDNLLDAISTLIVQETPPPNRNDFMFYPPDFDGDYVEDDIGYNVALREWEEKEYIPVLNVISSYLYLNSKDDVRITINQNGGIAPQKKEYTVNELFSGDSPMFGMTSKYATETLLLMIAQEKIKELKTRHIRNKDGD